MSSSLEVAGLAVNSFGASQGDGPLRYRLCVRPLAVISGRPGHFSIRGGSMGG